MLGINRRWNDRVGDKDLVGVANYITQRAFVRVNQMGVVIAGSGLAVVQHAVTRIVLMRHGVGYCVVMHQDMQHPRKRRADYIEEDYQKRKPPAYATSSFLCDHSWYHA
jgi:hypothetical protein